MAVTRRTTASADDYAPEAVPEGEEAQVDLTAEPENEDETPRHAGIVQAGLKAAKKLKESGGDFAKDLRLSEEEQLVKFLDEDGEPFASYRQHWVERTGKKSFTCIAVDIQGSGCPLCALGDKPRKMYSYNVALIESNTEVSIQVLNAGTKLFDLLVKAHEGKKGPLQKAYWSLSRSGSKQSGWSSSVTPVAARDLEEDWEIDEAAITPLISALKLYDLTIVQMPTKAALREIAAELE